MKDEFKLANKIFLWVNVLQSTEIMKNLITLRLCSKNRRISMLQFLQMDKKQ